jgi:hypothetical protein
MRSLFSIGLRERSRAAANKRTRELNVIDLILYKIWRFQRNRDIGTQKTLKVNLLRVETAMKSWKPKLSNYLAATFIAGSTAVGNLLVTSASAEPAWQLSSKIVKVNGTLYFTALSGVRGRM